MTEYSFHVPVRIPARIVDVPALARPLVRGSVRKERGARRLFNRIAKSLHRLGAIRLGVPTLGALAFAGDGRDRILTANFANTAFIDYANRVGEFGFEPEITAFLDAVAPRADVIYDVGANWGYFLSVLMTNPDFKGRVHAFEIAPRTYRDLLRTVEACGTPSRVQAHPFGLSERPGTVSIVEGIHSTLTRVVPKGGTEVPVRTLDDLDLPPPDIVKIDVEGHEAAVFAGGRRVLGSAKPLIVFESWFDDGDVAGMLRPMILLEDMGYRFFEMVWGYTAEGRAVRMRRRPSGVPGAVNELILRPLAVAERPALPVAINIVAVHPDREAEFLAAV